MTMNAIVVDTNVLIEFLKKNNRLTELLGQYDKLLIPAAVDAEFRAGLDVSTKSGYRGTQLLDELLADEAVEFLPVGRDESLKYAMLYRVLRQQGTPIPINDIWISAAALVRNVAVCTFDKHFRHVPLLQVIAAQ